MNKSYYHFKKEEFESIRHVVKNQIQEIWGNDLERSNESLDDEAIFLRYFEEYQHLIRVETLNLELKKASLDLHIDEEKIAAFIYKVRNSKYPFELKKSMDKLWLQCHKDNTNKTEGLIWLNVESIEGLSVSKTGIERYMINVSSGRGGEYRASKFSLPELLIQDALSELLSLISKKVN
ncbi:hypothetical protein [Pantoea agglomerans]